MMPSTKHPLIHSVCWCTWYPRFSTKYLLFWSTLPCSLCAPDNSWCQTVTLSFQLWLFVVVYFHPYSDEDSRYVIFFCGHIYHHRCVSKKNEVGHTCHPLGWRCITVLCIYNARVYFTHLVFWRISLLDWTIIMIEAIINGRGCSFSFVLQDTQAITVFISGDTLFAILLSDQAMNSHC